MLFRSYPLSDGPSTRDHRITMTDFRLCSIRRSRSQAGLCHYTRRTISDRSEPTFARLRYSLGGDRPSQTARLAMFLCLIQGERLEFRHHKGGISRLAPRELALPLHSLPPILHMRCQNPIPGYSKGARGLSVQSRVSGIFTAATVSPSSCRRQQSSRYTIRAGRNFMFARDYSRHRLYVHLSRTS